jgi:hypothetical protein
MGEREHAVTPEPAYELINGAGRQLLSLWRRGRLFTLTVGVPGSKHAAMITMSDEQAAGLAAAITEEET